MIPRFALDFVNPHPGWLFARRRLCPREGDFHFQSILGATEDNATGDAGSMAVETVLAGGDHGSLELQNGFIAQARRIGEIAGDTADGSDEPFVRIQTQRNLMRKCGHD